MDCWRLWTKTRPRDHGRKASTHFDICSIFCSLQTSCTIFLWRYFQRKVSYLWITTNFRSKSGFHDVFGKNFQIRRKFIFEDGYSQLNDLSSNDLKTRIRIEFISPTGQKEPGVDGGGLFKEFFTEFVTTLHWLNFRLVKTAYRPEYGLFKEGVGRNLYPNPSVFDVVADWKSQFEFLGKILGKAIYDGIQVDIPLANFFLAKLVGKFNYGILKSMKTQF